MNQAVIAKIVLDFVINKAANKIHEEDLKKAQDYIDNQCIEKMKPYVPVSIPGYRKSGKLRDSVKIAEPGKIIYTSPFALFRYYQPWKSHLTGNPNGASYWFEVMKERHGNEILRGAAAVAKGKSR